MKCDILLCQKMGSIPVIELRSVVLKDNERIIVPQPLSLKLQQNYKRRLIKVGEVEREVDPTRGFIYDAWQKPAAVEIARPVVNIVEAVESDEHETNTVADKSMFSKLRKRK